MFSAKITNIEKIRHQASGVDFLDVTIELAEDDLVFERKLALEPTISQEDLQAEVQKYLAAFQLEQDQKVANAEQDAIEAHVTELQTDLIGSELTINHEENNAT